MDTGDFNFKLDWNQCLQRLRNLRKERGLTQRQLGKGIGGSHAQISRWELLANAPKQETLEKIASGFGNNSIELLNFLLPNPRTARMTQELATLRDEPDRRDKGMRKIAREIGVEVGFTKFRWHG